MPWRSARSAEWHGVVALMPLVRLATAGARSAASRMVRGTAEAAGPLLGELLAPSRCRALLRDVALAGGSENPSVTMDD